MSFVNYEIIEVTKENNSEKNLKIKNINLPKVSAYDKEKLC